MSTARLRALRLVGFKSFAEKTTVEFGAGISAVVGPNGSGKSNLADALRWALGEQGRSLRTRRAEDLIFAGSSSRRAVGMADVTLVIDNEDRLLPVDFAEIELGRRLYRSGENEYLLNRQRIRLRDLVDLLDEANLADNAFLFIGQGMVDQALALRPEERRPLFEEAAGIRKHERRRRAAEAELAEAETNLERVRDLLAELRPQARRLAAQAEQQERRRSAGTELAAALVEVARARLDGAARDAAGHRKTLDSARAAADAAMIALRSAEEEAGSLGRALAERAESERAGRAALDAARGRAVELRLAQTRIAGDLAALGRDRARAEDARRAAGARIEEARTSMGVALPDPDATSTDDLARLDATLADARRQLAELQESGLAAGERDARMRQLRATRLDELERVRRIAADARRRADDQERLSTEAEAAATDADATRAIAAEATARAVAAEVALETERDQVRGELTAAETTQRDAVAAGDRIAAELGNAQARSSALDQLLQVGADERTLRQARARGARRLAEGLEVEPSLRAAVEAALGDALTGLVVDHATALALREGSAVLLLTEAGSPAAAARERPSAAQEREVARVEAAARAKAGGQLRDAIRRDPDGNVGRLLGRTLWVPALEAALELRSLLPAGWRVVTPAGEVVTDLGLIHLGVGASVLEVQAEREQVVRSIERLAGEHTAGEGERTRARAAVESARAAADQVRGALETAHRDRRVAEEEERSSVRRAETAARESAWQVAQRDRLTAQAQAAAAELSALEQAEVSRRGPVDDTSSARVADPGAEVSALEGRVSELETLREERAVSVEADRRRYAEAVDTRRRAEITLSLESARLDELDAEVARIVGLDADATAQSGRVAGDLDGATAEEQARAAALDQTLTSATEDRTRLLAAETAAATARERLREAESSSRAAEVAEMELRHQADAAREGLLVELAGIGPDGLVALEGSDHQPEAATEDDPAARLEAALDEALERWRLDATSTAAAERARPPGPGRVAALRRRYHELGVSNPFAAQEYAEVSARLESLEAQRGDLDRAIGSTRELIGTLNTLIADQFHQTFQALEGAFARRFRQLFDGGDAQLILTDPEDLSATGVEITARPPGKKRQPLAMLSGGERALTAVALLMAMLEVRPVPFCVLDEVDAALDEANIGRFSSALRSLAEHIQFVVITHNRGTIEAADALYGVTVGDDAVSRVISLRLADVERNGHADVSSLGSLDHDTARPAVAVPIVGGPRAGSTPAQEP